ncbi:lasso RiPP family leader peptide-containing protein [Streptomyces sp. NPDC052020]
MSEVLESIETVDVYEPPLLAEAGDYAEATQGTPFGLPEGLLSYAITV